MQPILPSLSLAAVLVAGCQHPGASPAPLGFTADASDLWKNDRGHDSPRWPAASPLFATDLANAEFAPGSWSWENGVLTAKGPGDIWTREAYGDFVMSLEFRCAEHTNSGVFLRCGDIVNWLNTAIEVQILQGPTPDPKHRLGAIFDCLAPKQDVAIAPGEWHRFVITVKGSQITVALDRQELLLADLDQWTAAHLNPDGTPNKFANAYRDMPRAGRIGLQYHGRKIEFRQLYVERL